MHGPIGAVIAKRDFGITDNEILRAIEIHTTGDTNMSLLEKIIFFPILLNLEEPFQESRNESKGLSRPGRRNNRCL